MKNIRKLAIKNTVKLNDCCFGKDTLKGDYELVKFYSKKAKRFSEH